MKSTNYRLKNIRLAKSILVKCDIASVTMNKSMLEEKKISELYNPTDKSTWQYYINLSGNYFKDSNGVYLQDIMYITLQETGETRILTKELLNEYLLTKDALLTFDEYFDALINLYPENTTLIYGMLYDIDINKASRAIDGTILAYGNKYLEEQESSLMSLVENSVKKYMSRWNIPEYGLVDDLYAAGLISTLAPALLLFIENVRLEMVTTYEVHSYHMTAYFNSNLKLGQYVDILTKESRMWLYKNLRTLITDLGKHKTLEDVIEHILLANNISVSKISVRPFTPNIVSTTDAYSPYYIKNMDNLVREYRDKVTDNINTETVLRMESDYVMDFSKEYVYSDTGYNRGLMSRVGNDGGIDEDTKIIILKLNDYSFLEPINYNTLLIESTIEYLDVSSNNIFNYIDPNTNISYTLTGDNILIVLLYHLIQLYGNNDMYIRDLYLSNSFDKDFDIVRVLTNIDTEWYGKTDVFTGQLNIVRDKLQTNIVNVTDIPKFILGQMVTGKLLQEFMTNSDSAKHVANSQIVRNRLRREKKITITDKNETILETLNNNNIFINAGDDYSHIESLTTIVKSITGLGLRVIPDDYLYKIKRITESLTSYTIQIVLEDNTRQVLCENLTPLPITGLNIIKIIDAEVDCQLDF